MEHTHIQPVAETGCTGSAFALLGQIALRLPYSYLGVHLKGASVFNSPENGLQRMCDVERRSVAREKERVCDAKANFIYSFEKCKDCKYCKYIHVDFASNMLYAKLYAQCCCNLNSPRHVQS